MCLQGLALLTRRGVSTTCRLDSFLELQVADSLALGAVCDWLLGRPLSPVQLRFVV